MKIGYLKLVESLKLIAAMEPGSIKTVELVMPNGRSWTCTKVEVREADVWGRLDDQTWIQLPIDEVGGLVIHTDATAKGTAPELLAAAKKKRSAATKPAEPVAI